MGIYSKKTQFQNILKPLHKLCKEKRIHPNTMTVIGIASSIIIGFVFFVAETHTLWLIMIPLLTLVRITTNALDGMLARSTKGINHNIGEVLNELGDRISDAFIFLGLAFSTYVWQFVGELTLVLILLNSYLSILSKAAGASRQYRGIMGKADRMIVISIMSILTLVFRNFSIINYGLVGIFFSTGLTMVQRYKSTTRELR